jgi:hypothetical protein
MTNCLAASGDESLRGISRNTRSGSAFDRDFENDMSWVKKITCAMLDVVNPAALRS